MSDTRTNDEILADVQRLVDSMPSDAPRATVLDLSKLERAEGLGLPPGLMFRHAMETLRAYLAAIRPRRSRQLRSPRRRQQLRTWARETGGSLVAGPAERRVIVGIDRRRGAPASVGPATTEDAQAFTTWLATRERRGLG
jgi:hypothetical protein